MDVDVDMDAGDLSHSRDTTTMHDPSSSQALPPATQHMQISPQAGPSQLPFYPLKRPPAPPPLRMRLHPTHDLISRLNIMPAYNELVRPYTRVPDSSDPTMAMIDDKGKGKEVESIPGAQAANRTAHLPGESNAATAPTPTPMTLEEKRQKTGKHERGWKMFTQRVSGPFSVKKDSALQNIVRAQPRQRVELNLFDRHTLESFSLSEGQLDEQSLRALGLQIDGDKEKEKKKDREKKKNKHKQEQLIKNAQPGSALSIPQLPSGGPTPSSQPHTPGPSHPSTSNHPPPQSHPPPMGVHPNGYALQPQQHAPSINGDRFNQSVPPVVGTPGNSGKANKVRKERDEGGGGYGGQVQGQGGMQPGSNGMMGQTQGQGPPRPHKKRKTDSQPSAAHHGLPPHPRHPQQQATPTFAL